MAQALVDETSRDGQPILWLGTVWFTSLRQMLRFARAHDHEFLVQAWALAPPDPTNPVTRPPDTIRKYGSYPSAADWVRDGYPHHGSFFECTGPGNHKLFADVEWTTPQQPLPDEVDGALALLRTAIGAELYRLYPSRGHSANDWVLLDGSRSLDGSKDKNGATAAGFKNSFHFIHRWLRAETMITQSLFWNAVDRRLKRTDKARPDHAVYGTNRCFRCIGSHKPTDPTTTPFRIVGDGRGRDLTPCAVMESLVTAPACVFTSRSEHATFHLQEPSVVLTTEQMGGSQRHPRDGALAPLPLAKRTRLFVALEESKDENSVTAAATMIPDDGRPHPPCMEALMCQRRRLTHAERTVLVTYLLARQRQKLGGERATLAVRVALVDRWAESWRERFLHSYRQTRATPEAAVRDWEAVVADMRRLAHRDGDALRTCGGIAALNLCPFAANPRPVPPDSDGEPVDAPAEVRKALQGASTPAAACGLWRDYRFPAGFAGSCTLIASPLEF